MKMKARAEFLTKACWAIALLAVLPAVIAWYTGPHGGFADVTGYNLFPLLGLIAFTLMWSHYIVAAIRLMLGLDKSVTRRFKQVTGWIVLAAIILHPSILVFTLWREGFGLPPSSYLKYYVAPNLQWAAGMGAFALLAFLAYELHRWFEAKNWWPYVQALSDAAMVLILVHGFTLGGDLSGGWFRLVWLFYAETFLAALGFMYYFRFKRKRNMVG